MTGCPSDPSAATETFCTDHVEEVNKRGHRLHATQHEKATAFRALHEGEAFVIPNPSDAGSAMVLAGLGFRALATTSSGLAFTLGRVDGGASLEETLEHARQLDRATSLPVSVDLENGYGRDPEDTAAAIVRTAETGAVGGSIEDYDPDGTIYSREHATERVAAACETARRLDFPFVVTARAENFIRGNTDLDDTIVRLQAYEQAGADVLYAPGLTTTDQIRSVCDAITKPVNVLARPNLSLREIADAGARRISTGGRLTWVAVNAFVDAATAIRDGDFSSLDGSSEFAQWLAP